MASLEKVDSPIRIGSLQEPAVQKPKVWQSLLRNLIHSLSLAVVVVILNAATAPWLQLFPFFRPICYYMYKETDNTQSHPYDQILLLIKPSVPGHTWPQLPPT